MPPEGYSSYDPAQKRFEPQNLFLTRKRPFYGTWKGVSLGYVGRIKT